MASGALVILLAFVVGAVGMATTGSQRAVERVTDPGGDPSVTARVDSDLRALDRFIEEPIRGYGLGNWAGVSDEAAAAADPTASPYVHNAYLNFGGATGVLGMAWIAAIVVLLVVSGAVIAVRGSPPGTPVLGVAIVMVGVFTGTQFLFDDNLRNPQYAALLAWTLGGGVAAAVALRGRLSTARRAAGRCASST
jgi:O-antigen ligase